MTLADTSVWVDHFRNGNARLSKLLDDGLILVHPFIIGELALGNLRKRDLVLADLEALPHAAAATNDEVMELIDRRCFWGQGIGWTDAHLVASALLSNCALWTIDKALNRVVVAAGVRAHRG